MLTLDDDCDAECQAATAARIAAAGCDELSLFPTLRMASARCTGRTSGGGCRSGRAGRGGGAVDLARLPRVRAADPDAIVSVDPRADGLEDDAAATAAAPNGSVPWGLDRMNQAALPLDGSATTPCYPSRGSGVTVYVLDSDIRADHELFGGRASGVVAPGARFSDATDESGHGSHVAGTTAGATTGVAPAATVVGVRVLNARGRGSQRDVISGIEYVAAIKAAAGERGAKVVMSLSFTSTSSGGRPMRAAANRAAAAGVVVSIAAGNNGPASACRNHPASTSDAITVAASSRTDRLARFSARGDCVDVDAPGVGVLSVDASSRGGLRQFSGTSMAAPHVGGLAALILAEDAAGGGLDGGEVLDRMTRDAPTVGGFPLAWANPSCE